MAKKQTRGESCFSPFWCGIALCAGKKSKATERDVCSKQFVQFRLMFGLLSVTLSYQKGRDGSSDRRKSEVEMALVEHNLK